jgi:hypothetical protein
MLPHLYWALGGVIGLNMFTPSVLALPQLKLINWIASFILTAAGLLGLAFIYIKKNKLISVLLLAFALIGSMIATSHGIYGLVYRALQLLGLVNLDSDYGNAQSYLLWDLFLFEPWFIIEGILLGCVGWFYLSTSRLRRNWFILCVIGILVGIFTGLLGVRFA